MKFSNIAFTYHMIQGGIKLFQGDYRGSAKEWLSHTLGDQGFSADEIKDLTDWIFRNYLYFLNVSLPAYMGRGIAVCRYREFSIKEEKKT